MILNEKRLNKMVVNRTPLSRMLQENETNDIDIQGYSAEFYYGK
jgi:hypothetical protein